MTYVFPIYFLNDLQVHFLHITPQKVSFYAQNDATPLISMRREEVYHSIAQDVVVFQLQQKLVKFTTSFVKSLRNLLYFNAAAPVQYSCIGDGITTQLVLRTSSLVIIQNNQEIANEAYEASNIFDDKQFIFIYHNTANNTSLFARLEMMSPQIAKEVKEYCTFLRQSSGTEELVQYPQENTAVTPPPRPVEPLQQDYFKEGQISAVLSINEEGGKKSRNSQLLYSFASYDVKALDLTLPSDVKSTQDRDPPPSISVASRKLSDSQNAAFSYFNYQYNYVDYQGKKAVFKFISAHGYILAVINDAKNPVLVYSIRIVDIIEKACVVSFTFNEQDFLFTCVVSQGKELMWNYKHLPFVNFKVPNDQIPLSLEQAVEILSNQYQVIVAAQEVELLVLRCMQGAVYFVEMSGCTYRSQLISYIAYIRRNEQFYALYFRTNVRQLIFWVAFRDAEMLLSAWRVLNYAVKQ